MLSGYPGQQAVIARRKGDVWYVAGVNGTAEAATLTFTPDFLPAGGTMTLIRDGEDNRTFTIEQGVAVADPTAPIEVACLPRGGFTAVIRP